MNVTIQGYLDDKKKLVDYQLIQLLKMAEAPKQLKEAMLYSVEAGGKRLRPILMLAVIEALNSEISKGIQPACALEYIHTYSLIHDDLPAMDNDDLRRGLPTNHKKFNEATAILAGDGLLTFAFECLTRAPHLEAEQKVWLVQALSSAAGPAGMVGGQIEDIEAEGADLNLIALERVHQKKTGRLLEYAVMAGAVIAGADAQTKEKLKMFARHLGLAFQIQDDILDVEGEEERMGKPIGSDEGNKKNTYPKILGIEGAKEQLAAHFEKALDALEDAKINDTALEGIARFIIERTY
ncbi:geranylgeranyl diphosphate synthase type II [Pullulanibacillus pueri]|uniref:Farnesyl diphosphate synthase n=1 Tax=Pullulanibacillus pueri TaxID=1437324 RepID=A0A8J2ZVJ5_9BACL|nr:farnesyl diphosphate synthase [Pullulanibacillus pueri]MBM7681598.1 geranylgeranyl diphosphate synthase type II [Pullulanibacillus pueri]GGH79518.1 farnesyl-diphosphate synthase [Pullulanibacillus pueri]